MSTEKSGEVVQLEKSHGIAPSADAHYHGVAEGTGKTLDVGAGAKAKEVHNVSTHSIFRSLACRHTRAYARPLRVRANSRA